MEGAPKLMEDTLSDKDKKALQLIEDITINADEIQTRVLGEILSKNANAEYLQRNGLNGRTDRQNFKNIMPIVTYEDLIPDINRIINGDTSPILCQESISQFFSSSGTSGGQMNLIPMTEDEIVRRLWWLSLVTPVKKQYITGLNRGMVMEFMFSRSDLTPGGIVANTLLTGFYRSSTFQNRPRDPSTNFTSPYATFICLDSYQSMYSQMLCGLVQNQQVVQVGTTFAYGFVRVIQFLEKNWNLLCNDIRTGTINPEIVTDPSVKEAVSKILIKPNPELATFIENECRRDCFSWKGIIPRLWPNAKCINTIITGSMSHYVPTLEYYGNGLPLVSNSYASTECTFGLNLNPLCHPSEVSYTFIANMAYFEFLPISMPEESLNEHEKDGYQQQDNELVDLVNVKLGQKYEIVVTTYCGLYRYRVGDQHYIPTLEYYGNGLPLVSTAYASTECTFGLNLKPLCQPSEVYYTFIPNLAYFEFLPISMPEQSPNEHEEDGYQQQDHELVELVNVKLGQKYEVVVTTYCGLYRYRVGDVVRVSGFKNKTPQFSFVCRRNVILSISFAKTDEVDLQNAVQNAVKNHLMPLDVSLLDYTSYADMSAVPGHYVLFWELRDQDHGATLSLIHPSVFEDCCLTIEESLNSIYRLYRATDKSIDPLEIKIVESGTFDVLVDYAIRRGASVNQYKTPRCVKSTLMVEIMNSRVISSYFSQKCPQYAAGHRKYDVQPNQN